MEFCYSLHTSRDAHQVMYVTMFSSREAVQCRTLLSMRSYGLLQFLTAIVTKRHRRRKRARGFPNDVMFIMTFVTNVDQLSNLKRLDFKRPRFANKGFVFFLRAAAELSGVPLLYYRLFWMPSTLAALNALSHQRDRFQSKTRVLVQCCRTDLTLLGPAPARSCAEVTRGLKSQQTL